MFHAPNIVGFYRRDHISTPRLTSAPNRKVDALQPIPSSTHNHSNDVNQHVYWSYICDITHDISPVP